MFALAPAGIDIVVFAPLSCICVPVTLGVITVGLVVGLTVHVRIGDGAQTTTTADPFLPANWEAYFAVTPGQRIAAIRASTGGLVTATDGTLWVTEMS